MQLHFFDIHTQSLSVLFKCHYLILPFLNTITKDTLLNPGASAIGPTCVMHMVQCYQQLLYCSKPCVA